MEQTRPVVPLLKVPPPLVVLALVGAGVGVQFAASARILPEGSIQLAVGLPLVALGVMVMAAGMLTFRRARTDITFSNPPSLVVQHGIYKRTRNPMYLGDALVMAGIAFAVNSWWLLALLPVLVVYLQLGVIRREELFLERNFAEPYLRYRAAVRRWL